MKLTIRYIKETLPYDEFTKSFEGETANDCKEQQFNFERNFLNIGSYKAEIIELL